MLSGTLGTSMLRDVMTGEGALRGEENITI